MEGIKYDNEKLRWDLLPYDALQEVVKVITFGAEKYDDNNWKLLDNAKDRYFAAGMRHRVAHKLGNKYDDETGILHKAHECCNLLFEIWFELDKTKGAKI